MTETTNSIKFSTFVSAIKSRDVIALRSLLKNKHVELIDKKHETVLHVAARLGDVDVIRTLLENWRVGQLLDEEMYNADTPLVVAARSRNVLAVQTFADHGANVWQQILESGNTILHLAAGDCNSDLLQALIARNPPRKTIDKTNKFGETALDIALMQYSPNVQFLLQAGADYSKPNVFTARNVLHTSVAYNQCGMLQEFLASQNSHRLTDLTDRRGDTPLMLAIRTSCMECVQVLIKFLKKGKEINEVTGESLLHMAVQSDRNDILSTILMFSHEHVINHKDIEGRSPLLLAIEIKKNQCLKKLMNTQNVYEKNGITQETALHTALRVNNEEATALLMKSNNHAGAWCFSQQNRDGKTPFWVAVESDNAQFVTDARKGHWVDIEELNHQGDSCTFVAAACGHLKVLKTLLLSDKFYSFCRTYDKDMDLYGKTLVREAEISCNIYSSDIFILTDEIRQNRSHSWFPKTFFRINEKNHRNIFHACALGGNVYCLNFIFTLVKMFNNSNLSLFHQPDIFGNSPLQIASVNDLGGPECVYYFLLHHANISSYNNKGEFVLESILNNTEHSTDLLMSLLNEGISYDQEARGLQQESESLRVNFSILRPSEHIVQVVRLFYDKIDRAHKYPLLEHPLLKMYVHLVLTRVNYFFIIRFLLSCCSTLLLTVYLIFYSHIEAESPVIQYIRYSLGFLNVLGLLFSVPLLIHNELTIIGILTMTLMVMPCLLILGLTAAQHRSDFSFDIASLTVLISFFSLMMYSAAISRTISHQMAMLSQVIYRMLIYTGTVFFVLLSFSLAFYCIFDNSFYFVSPFKSFIYTTDVLFLEDTSESFNFFENKHFSHNRLNTTHSSIRTLSEFIATQLDLYFECTILLAFIIMVNLALMNMLVSLAVRDGKTLETSGSIFRRHLQIHWLSNLEMFLDSCIYKVIKNSPLIYLLGIVPSITFIDVDMIYYPMYEKRNSPFTRKSVRELKRTFTRSTGSPVTTSNLDLKTIIEAVLKKKTQ